MLTSVVSGGMDAVSGAEGLGKASVGLCALILIYAAFPIAQVVRSAGDSLAESKSSMVNFVFKDLIVASIKVVGHIAALTALFGAICSTVAWILNGSGMTIGVEMIGVFDYLYALPVEAMSAFLGMLGLGFVDVIIGNFMTWDVTGSEASGYTVDGALAVGWEFVQVVIILAKLYVVLAFYHFFWGVLNTFFNWIKSPYLPFKSS